MKLISKQSLFLFQRIMRTHHKPYLMNTGKFSNITGNCHMPDMDGLEATRRIRAAESGTPVPLIARTAPAMAGDREKALEAGCNDYDTKPVDLDRLLGKIQALLGGAQ